MTVATALRLNLACGASRWEGFVNSDIHGGIGTEIVDLDSFPYPYEDGSAELILMSHALFMRNVDGGPLHPDPAPILTECHRILQSGGWLRIDDNPIRCFDNRDHLQGSDYDNEAETGFPVEFRRPRSQLRSVLQDIGFSIVADVAAGTVIPSAPAVVLRNSLGKLSFTIEAQK